MRRPLGRFGVRGGVAVGLAILVLAAVAQSLPDLGILANSS